MEGVKAGGLPGGRLGDSWRLTKPRLGGSLQGGREPVHPIDELVAFGWIDINSKPDGFSAVVEGQHLEVGHVSGHEVRLGQHEAQVDDFHAALIQALQTPDFDARFALLEPAVQRLFDLQTIARISLSDSSSSGRS